MSSAGFRASIPSSVRKTIQNIKEITGNHSEEDVYAMLKECSMDPNETAQKLLLQDTFHEVKRKRDKRKENLNNRESVEPRWRPGTQGRGGGRGGRGNFSPHNASHDAAGSKNSGTGKDNGIPQVTEKVALPKTASQETISKEKSSGTSSIPANANGPISVTSGTTSGVSPLPSSAGTGDRMGPSSGDMNKLNSALPSDSSNKVATVASGSGPILFTSNHPGSGPASSSAAYFSSSDPVLVPSDDSWFPGAVGAIKREVGNIHPLGELNDVNSAENKLTAGKTLGKSQGAPKNHITEMSPASSTVTHASPSTSRPSSNYSTRSQQLIGPQKAGSNKEWKPKPTYTTNQGSTPVSASEARSISADTTGQLQSASSALDSEEATTKLQRKLEDFHLPQRQHVILPNHIIVPDSEKNKFSFGSLGVTFGVNTSYVSGPESEKSSTSLSETSQAIEETVEERDSSQNAALTSEVGDYPDHPQSPTNGPENLSSSEVDGSSSAIQEYSESKQETALPSGGHQYSGVQTSPNYSFGFVPPMLGTQLTPFDNSESQTRDISRLPSFIVHQQLDPASYYAQFYRTGADSDGRLSPFSSAGANTKYNGNVTVLPAPNSQSPQEGGVLSTAGPTPLVTQAAGLMQSSIPVTQQPVPVFRPSGVHISHYPPNYIHYGPYFSPFYVSPPAIHQFLGNGAFPQQPQASTVYPPPQAVAATGMKYPLPQFKPGANAANPTHLVMPSAYGVYGSSPAGYNHNSAATAGNSTSNEDLGSSQFKESNVYIGGQQSEGSAVWMAAPGRDITSLPTSTFYNLPPQGQHVTFAPTQAGHGTFAGIYHPAQAVTAATVHPLLQQSQTMAGAVDMVGPGGNVYQQPQHAQINWPSNY
ncbi:GBF-interacting protein 1-like isoform X2 [Abrus precatorius]|uniref:GBF-interacting protein 1-like isoform X2 n=1 Tax=Abrus precatorius TaxID=3816 RepID=A0A8B8JEP2_ABRPR|nr:GBF-interacting protein 1-like isoform X2 [Abrus precatorius]